MHPIYVHRHMLSTSTNTKKAAGRQAGRQAKKSALEPAELSVVTACVPPSENVSYSFQSDLSRTSSVYHSVPEYSEYLFLLRLNTIDPYVFGQSGTAVVSLGVSIRTA